MYPIVLITLQREEQIKREMERQNRERRKEEERQLKEKQREEDRFQREQRKEIERREKFLQKESQRVSMAYSSIILLNTACSSFQQSSEKEV
jgi:uncharacterized membrane-anchored protein